MGVITVRALLAEQHDRIKKLPNSATETADLVQEARGTADQQVVGGHGRRFCARGVNFRLHALQKRIRRVPMVAVGLYPFAMDSVDPQ